MGMYQYIQAPHTFWIFRWLRGAGGPLSTVRACCGQMASWLVTALQCVVLQTGEGQPRLIDRGSDAEAFRKYLDELVARVPIVDAVVADQEGALEGGGE